MEEISLRLSPAISTLNLTKCWPLKHKAKTFQWRNQGYNCDFQASWLMLSQEKKLYRNYKAYKMISRFQISHWRKASGKTNLDAHNHPPKTQSIEIHCSGSMTDHFYLQIW